MRSNRQQKYNLTVGRRSSTHPFKIMSDVTKSVSLTMKMKVDLKITLEVSFNLK